MVRASAKTFDHLARGMADAAAKALTPDEAAEVARRAQRIAASTAFRRHFARAALAQHRAAERQGRRQAESDQPNNREVERRAADEAAFENWRRQGSHH